jgi:hypothetical protein
MAMMSDRDEERVVLSGAEAAAVSCDAGDGERVRAGIGAVIGFECGRRGEKDQGWGGLNAESCPITVRAPEYHPKRSRCIRDRQGEGRVECQAHATGRERQARLHRHASGGMHSEPPGDSAKSEAAAHIQDSLAQAILEMHQVIRRHPEPFDKLRACVVGHY